MAIYVIGPIILEFRRGPICIKITGLYRETTIEAIEIDDVTWGQCVP
jgi:hypothetical protein